MCHVVVKWTRPNVRTSILAEIKKQTNKKKKNNKKKQKNRKFGFDVITLLLRMLTGIGLKVSLKIGQNCSKHTYVKTFDQNHLSIYIILLQKKICVFFFVLFFFSISTSILG